MTSQVPQLDTARLGKPAAPRSGRGRLPKMFRSRTLMAAIIACVLATIYWGLIASERYVSEAHVIVQRTDLNAGQGASFGSLLAGAVDGNHNDQMLLRDYLLSMDMLAKLDKALNLRKHYSSREHDMFSRMWSANMPAELFQRYYLSRVSVELDDYSGVLVIKAQGYDPATAQAITRLLVAEGERHMNDMGHRLALEQVAFVEQQANTMGERLREARRDVLAMQNKLGLVSPQSTAENTAAIVNRLDAQRTDLETRRTAMLGYLAPTAPNIVELELQIAAIDKQIIEQQSRLTAPTGKPLNANVEEYQRLELGARFAEDAYKTTLVALEKSRFEAGRTLKKVTVVQSPTRPEFALEPARAYNIVVFVLVTALIAGIVHLLAIIIRDHKD
jgi:capsular polysaccharide transport system permease protein